mmetsp:Transcript_8723/g.18640  ORF Transcript_8723/g.18640 Transcript_8723/m.18640 type:complete len:83 (+) Transcript_8723:1340-1588(+)
MLSWRDLDTKCGIYETMLKHSSSPSQNFSGYNICCSFIHSAESGSKIGLIQIKVERMKFPSPDTTSQICEMILSCLQSIHSP